MDEYEFPQYEVCVFKKTLQKTKKTSRRTVKSSQPREPTPTQAGHVTVLSPISHIGGGAGWVPAREAGFDVPTHVPSVATRSNDAAR